MTKEKAIETLADIAWNAGSFDREKIIKACDIAIKALESETLIKKTSSAKISEDKPTGEWVGVMEYCKYLTKETGILHVPAGLNNFVYCNTCWESQSKKSNFCPNCGADMRAESEVEE